MENEKIFVVVPVYKVEAYLERCIDSILNQTYTNWELVLVDDGSPDSCPAICDRYAAEYENITVIHQENGGVSSARNSGIQYVQQADNPQKTWFTFIDSDDFVHPFYLEYLYKCALETQSNISICGYVHTKVSEFTFNGSISLSYMSFSPEFYWCSSFTNAVMPVAKLYRSCLFQNTCYPVGKLYEDNFTTYKILFSQDSITVTTAPLYYWYTNPHSITRSAWSPNQLDAMEALESQLSFFKENGYSKAYTASAKELFRHCVKQSISIRLMSPSYDHLIGELCDLRKKAFALIVKELGLIPSTMYWFEIRIIKSIKRVFNNESIFSFIRRKLKKFFRIT